MKMSMRRAPVGRRGVTGSVVLHEAELTDRVCAQILAGEHGQAGGHKKGERKDRCPKCQPRKRERS